jgi:hypothetical protein
MACGGSTLRGAQESGYLCVSGAIGLVGGAMSELILRERVGALVEQHLSYMGGPGAGGAMKRRRAMVVARGGQGATFEE